MYAPSLRLWSLGIFYITLAFLALVYLFLFMIYFVVGFQRLLTKQLTRRLRASYLKRNYSCSFGQPAVVLLLFVCFCSFRGVSL